MSNKIISSLLFITIIILGYGYIGNRSNQVVLENEALGSVQRASEYQSRVLTPSDTDGARFEYCSTKGTLGSVVVTVAGAGTFTLYDSTTTNSALRANAATSSLRKLAAFGANQTVGTYTFDSIAFNGIVIDPNGAQGTTTITCR